MENWNRNYFTETGDNALIYFAVFGDFNADFNISGSQYRTAGIPEGADLLHYGRETHPDIFAQLLSGYAWAELERSNAALARKIEDAGECFVIRGEIADSDNLNYLRDVVGIITYLLDNGGTAVYDLQTINFWDNSHWAETIFNADGPVPRQHVKILFSEEEGNTKWYHTRGMRKFGRPDLSIHTVPSHMEVPIVDLLNRFIQLLAYGGTIPQGQKIKVALLPETMWCESKGDFDDPDFNNKHVEIHWK